MAIPFTQYVGGNLQLGVKYIRRPQEIEDLAKKLSAVGVRFASDLQPGQISITAFYGDGVPIAARTVALGRAQQAVDSVVRAASKWVMERAL